MYNNRYRNIGFRFIEKFITKAEKCNNYRMYSALNASINIIIFSNTFCEKEMIN